MSEDFLKHIDRLIAKRPLSKEALISYRELVSLMEGVVPHPQKISIESRLKDVKREGGFPLFSRRDLPLDFETGAMLLSRFMDHLTSTKREDSDGLKKALEKSKSDPDWTHGLFRAALEKKDNESLTRFARETDLDPKVLRFFAQLALRPSLEGLRHSVSEQIEKKGWDYGYCPVCGSEPKMAYLDKTGKRHLHCELCGEEWPYPRLNCPFCQNQEQKSLGYFESEQEQGLRVDFCRRCERYIKAVDQRVLEDAGPMELEYLASLHLDFLANKYGFM